MNRQAGLLYILGWTQVAVFMDLIQPEVPSVCPLRKRVQSSSSLWVHCDVSAILSCNPKVLAQSWKHSCHPQQGVFLSPTAFPSSRGCHLLSASLASWIISKDWVPPSSFAKGVSFCWQIQEQMWVEDRWLYPATRKGGGGVCLNTTPPFLKSKPQSMQFPQLVYVDQTGLELYLSSVVKLKWIILPLLDPELHFRA